MLGYIQKPLNNAEKEYQEHFLLLQVLFQKEMYLVF